MKEYYCKSCKKSFWYEEEQPFPKKCPECGDVNCRMNWHDNPYIQAEIVNIDSIMKENVRYSESLGVHPNQIERARQIHPGAEFTKDGAMIIHNRNEKIKRMKERTAFLRRQGSKLDIVEFS